MIPRDLLSFSFTEHEIVPHYFLEPDHIWLRALLDEYLRHEGRPRRELTAQLRAPLRVDAPANKVRIATHVLDRIFRYEVRADVEPRAARAVVFAEAARLCDRDEALRSAAAAFGVRPAQMENSLLADLPTERIVTPPKKLASVPELAQRANLALVAGMLRRAVAVSLEAGSDLRPVVRQAKLKGLLCSVSDASRLEISGPFALFRRTTLYGRALASLVPFALRCEQLELRAACILGPTDETKTLVLRAGDPLFPAPERSRYDSQLEKRFADDFMRAAPAWHVTREPEAIPADGTFIFPDFELQHRADPQRRWLVEICGFWTPQYIENKLRRLRHADLGDRLILCIDEERNCASSDLPAHAHVVRYRKRVDPAAVLAVIEREDWALLSRSTTRVLDGRPQLSLGLGERGR